MVNKQKATLIPMDDAIREFDKHLKSHPRTILSARFGDGKSCFLTAAERKLKKRYTFLKLYPVNYQVAENQDIFEYIKRDLLFQLFGQSMMRDTYEIPDKIAAYFFLCNNWKEYAEETLKELSHFDGSHTATVTLGVARFLRSMKKKYDEFKKNGGDLCAKLDRFITSFENKGIYEFDPITSILNDIIKDWKKNHPRKKVCLVFEDMDRIDPAHIFRIMNVISAQMDYGYKFGFSPRSNSLFGNKFGVDHIAVCLDYDNLKHIFHHFYGRDACFDGYINKFCDRGIFYYSLKEQVQQFYVNELVRVSSMDGKAIMAIMEQFDMSSYTLRQLYHALEDVGKQISMPTRRGMVIPHRGLFIMAAVLRRLGFSTEKIVSGLSKAFIQFPMEIGAYAGTCMMLRKNLHEGCLFFSFGQKEQGYTVVYCVEDYHQDGIAYIRDQIVGSWSPRDISKPEEEMEYIVGFVNK